MQSAFLDIGQDRDAFLHVSDLILPEESPGELEEPEGLDLEVDDDPEATEEEPGGRAWRREVMRNAPIQDRLREGRELLVQVARDAIRSKGPRVSCYLTLPGRYLVYLPDLGVRGVSRRIRDQEERDRLREILTSLPHEGGFIVRTAGEGKGSVPFRADADMLVASWREIRQRADAAAAPAMVYRELDLLRRLLRDAPLEGYAMILVDGEEAYDQAVRYLRDLDPQMAAAVRIHGDDTPLFREYGIDQEIEKALRPRVWLKSGGYLIIEQTEALVSIDVNTGKYVGRDDQEETVLRTNLEAAEEIARQLRLRDLGGIIVVDFIDMEMARSRRRVLETLETALGRDRARTKVVGLSDLGLVQLTRKRTRPGLGSFLTAACPTCGGAGRVRSPEWTAAEAIQEVRRLLNDLEDQDVTVRAHPETVRAVLAALQSRGLPGRQEALDRVRVEEDPSIRPDAFEVVAV
jgi:ribonuclease G